MDDGPRELQVTVRITDGGLVLPAEAVRAAGLRAGAVAWATGDGGLSVRVPPETGGGEDWSAIAEAEADPSFSWEWTEEDFRHWRDLPNESDDEELQWDEDQLREWAAAIERDGPVEAYWPEEENPAADRDSAPPAVPSTRGAA